MHSSHWEPPGVSERIWSVNLEASIAGESDCKSAFLPAFGVTQIPNEWYRWTMGVIVITLGTSRSAGENFEHTPGSVAEPMREAQTNSERCLSSYGYIFGELLAIRDAPDVDEQWISLNGKYNAWIIVHYCFRTILAIVFFKILLFALLYN